MTTRISQPVPAATAHPPQAGSPAPTSGAAPWSRARTGSGTGADPAPGAPPGRPEPGGNRLASQFDVQFRNNPLDHKYGHLPMRPVGAGAAWDVFEFPDRQHILSVGRPGSHELTKIMCELERLRRMDVPVGKVADIGNFGGRPAVVTRNYPEVARWSRPDSPAGQAFIKSPLVNANTVRDLRQIADALKTHRVSIHDFQLGIRPNGHVEVLGPTGVHRNDDVLHDNADQIDTLRRFITEIERHHGLTHLPS